MSQTCLARVLACIVLCLTLSPLSLSHRWMNESKLHFVTWQSKMKIASITNHHNAVHDDRYFFAISCIRWLGHLSVVQREISVVVFHFSSPDVAAPLMFDRQPEQESQLDSTLGWHLGSHRFTHLTCVHMSFRFLTLRLKLTTRMSPAKPEQHDQLCTICFFCLLTYNILHTSSWSGSLWSLTEEIPPPALCWHLIK